jgi:hypothetical protein
MIDFSLYDQHRCEGEVVSVTGQGILFRTTLGHELLLAPMAGEAPPRPGRASVILYVRASDADMLAPAPDDLTIAPGGRLTELTGEVLKFRRNGQELLARALVPIVIEFAEFAEWLDGMIDGQVLKVPVQQLFGVQFRPR